MTKRQFIGQRREAWRRFEKLVSQFDGGRRSKLPPADVAEFSRLFREVCYDLALIRSRDWGRALVAYLNNLVSRGHNCFYSAPPGNVANLVRFLAAGFPQVFRANIGYFLTAAALFFVPLAISWAVVQNDPTLASRIVDARSLEAVETIYSDDGPLENRRDEPNFGDQGAVMAGFYVRNNVGIALACFARGILFGAGTAYTLLYNGIVLGAISGYVIAHGHGERFLSFVVSHGSFELTAIAVAGGAGLMLGDALVHPGLRTRVESLRHRGLEAIQIASGAAVMLLVAAMIEAFWSPSSIPAQVKYAVGGSLWLLVFLYLSLAGRDHR